MYCTVTRSSWIRESAEVWNTGLPTESWTGQWNAMGTKSSIGELALRQSETFWDDSLVPLTYVFQTLSENMFLLWQIRTDYWLPPSDAFASCLSIVQISDVTNKRKARYLLWIFFQQNAMRITSKLAHQRFVPDFPIRKPWTTKIHFLTHTRHYLLQPYSGPLSTSMSFRTMCVRLGALYQWTDVNFLSSQRLCGTMVMNPFCTIVLPLIQKECCLPWIIAQKS